jgi:hypothetical protein
VIFTKKFNVKERGQGRDRNDNRANKSKGLRLRYKRMKENKNAQGEKDGNLIELVTSYRINQNIKNPKYINIKQMHFDLYDVFYSQCLHCE